MRVRSSFLLCFSVCWGGIALQHHFIHNVQLAKDVFFRINDILPLGGDFPTTKLRLDGESAEEALGFKFISYEETMKALIGQYIELKKMEKSIQ